MRMICIPKPSYLRAKLTRKTKPNSEIYQKLSHLSELFQLGEINLCHPVTKGKSQNFLVTTARGKFIFRKHRLSESDVDYEYEVLSYLYKQRFPAPHMLTDKDGHAWSKIGDSIYSIYEYEAGYYPTDFLWLPNTQRAILTQYGRTLAEYHQAVAGLVPSVYKWNGYRPTEHKRWREGEWFRQAIEKIRSALQKSTAISPFDDFIKSHIEEFDKMLELEFEVEKHKDLKKLVIHGDYAPWNVFFRLGGQSPFVLDFNEARLDLKIYDIMLATFWFAWQDNRLDLYKARTFQSGYCKVGQLGEIDISLAGSVFRWIMARSIVERLHKRYSGNYLVFKNFSDLENQYQMCIFAKRQPHQLVAGLKEAAVS